jgi:N-acetylmuramoyl-L-alanine amidase
MVKKIQYLITIVPILALLLAFALPPKGAGGGVQVIVIDPGHGGKDPGCLGNTHKEKDISLAVALKLGKYLEENLKNIKVIYTRKTDVFVELEDRALVANKAKADLFISIHCNAAGKPVLIKDPKTGKMRPKTFKNSKGRVITVETSNPVPYGTETYVMGLKNEEGKMKVATRENSAIFYEEDYEKKYGGFDPESEESYIIMSNYTSAYVIQSANLAVKIQEEYARKAGRIDKGVHRQSIWVLWRTSMPSILTELGYLTNPLEETFLGSEKGQDYLAKAIFRGIRKYKDETEGIKKEYTDAFEQQVALENENVLAKSMQGHKKADEEEEQGNNGNEALAKNFEKDNSINLNSSKQSVGTIPVVKGKELAEETNESKNSAEDSAVSAKEIAGKFLKENNSKRSETTIPIKNNTVINEPKKESSSPHGILFKVQFASSDAALDLKNTKFNCLQNADFYRVNNTLKYTSGQFTKADDARSHQSFLREKGFKDCFVVAFKNGERIDLNEALRLAGN